MKRFFLTGGLLLALALPAVPALASTGAARGKVLDEQGQPLEGAKILLEYLGGVTRKYEVKTNKKGEFTQVGLVPGQYKFTFTMDGYQGAQMEIKVTLGEPTYLPDVKLNKGGGGAASAQAAAAVQAAFTKGVEATKAGRWDDAEAAFKEVLAKDSTVAEAHSNLGYVYTQKKDWPAAEAAYLKALELKSDLGDATAGLMSVYNASGQKEKAEALAAQATSGEGGDPRVIFSAGLMALNGGKYDEAEAAFRKVEGLDASNAEVQYHLATIALNKGKTDECVQRLEKYLAMSPANPTNIATAQGLLAALKKK